MTPYKAVNSDIKGDEGGHSLQQHQAAAGTTSGSSSPPEIPTPTETEPSDQHGETEVEQKSMALALGLGMWGLGRMVSINFVNTARSLAQCPKAEQEAAAASAKGWKKKNKKVMAWEGKIWYMDEQGPFRACGEGFHAAMSHIGGGGDDIQREVVVFFFSSIGPFLH